MLKFSTEDCPKKMHLLLLGGVMVFGAAMRLWDLGTWSFWVDEVFTVRDAQALSWESWRVLPNPIPYLGVRLSVAMAGNSEWGARVMPCIVGILCIPAVFGLGRTLFNSRIGLLSSGFVACSSWHLFWSQNARYPVFTFFFGVLAAWFFYTALERDSVLLMIGALVSSICLILSHTLAVVIVPAFAVYALICLLESANRRRWLMLLIFFLPFGVPVLALAFPEVRGYIFSGWGRNVWQRSPLYIVLTVVEGVSIPVAVAAFFAPVATRLNRPTLFLTCYAGVPLLLFLLASQFQNVAGYYLFWTTPAYFILAAVVCERVGKAVEQKSRNVLAVLVPCVLLMTLLSQDYLYFKIENGGRPKWREAFAVVREESRPSDRVVLSEPEMGTYYLREVQHVYIGALLADSEAFESEWERLGRGRLWFLVDVASFNVFDADVRVRRWIRQRGRLVETLPAFSRAKDRTIHVYLVE